MTTIKEYITGLIIGTRDYITGKDTRDYITKKTELSDPVKDAIADIAVNGAYREKFLKDSLDAELVARKAHARGDIEGEKNAFKDITYARSLADDIVKNVAFEMESDKGVFGFNQGQHIQRLRKDVEALAAGQVVDGRILTQADVDLYMDQLQATVDDHVTDLGKRVTDNAEDKLRRAIGQATDADIDAHLVPAQSTPANPQSTPTAGKTRAGSA